MMEETATKHAPWHLIPANNKPYGRIVAFRILADRLGKDVSLDPRPIDPDLLKEAKRVLNLSASDIERASHPAERKVKLKRNHRFNRAGLRFTREPRAGALHHSISASAECAPLSD